MQTLEMKTFVFDTILVITLQLFISTKEVMCLRMIGVIIPQYTMHGEMALLQCQYDLGQDHLYSVTWYKDNEEFYRYVPARRPPQHIYKVEGFKIDHHRSDNQQVLLRSVNLKARGIYRCEVSAEAPSFTSVHGEGRMDVISLPQEGPFITGEEKIYKIGDTISANCTSGNSYPPAKLRWYINDEEVAAEYETILQQSPHDLMTTVSGLRFQVGPEHFTGTGGHIHIRCAATISTKDAVVQQRIAPPLIDNREALLLVQGDSSKIVPNLCLLIIFAVITYSWTILKSTFIVENLL